MRIDQTYSLFGCPERRHINEFVQIIRRRLQARGITERCSSLRAILAGQCRVTATFRRPDGRALPAREASQPAFDLGIRQSTVEAHRAKVVDKRAFARSPR